MADQKISELPLNSSINGTENVATERGGSNYKSSLQDIKDFVLENVPASGVQTVTGANVDNTDPENPIINQDDTKANQSDLTILEGQTVILQAENIAQQLELNDLTANKADKTDLDLTNIQVLTNSQNIQGLDDTKVDSVVAGSNVEVNNVDPLNPIVSAFPTTTAGLLSRTYFTGDTVTTSEGTFYKSNRDDKGTVATATQTVNVNDNQKAFFSQDLISDPYPIDTTIFAGAYSGVLNGLVSSNGGEQKFYVEIYKTDIDGVPIASGIAGSPVGDLGVTVVAIAESGLIDLQNGNETQFAITADLKENLSLLSTNLIRYHVAAEKVGTTGGAIDISISYGFDHVAHLDIPVQALTNTVINTDSVEFPSSATQYDINRDLKTNIDFNTQGIGVNAINIIDLNEKKVSSVTTGEPTGSNKVLNMVSLTQAEYDAGTPIATTFYIITP